MKDKNTNQSQRRNFLKSSLLLGASGLVLPAVSKADESRLMTADEEFQIISDPVLQTSFNNRMSLLWIVNKNAASWVEYGLSADNLDQKAYGKPDMGLRPIGTVNVITLQNLQAGKTYFYRVVSKEIVNFQPYKLTYGTLIQSPIQSFVNPDLNKQEINFVMMNDVHDRPQSIPFLLNMDKEKRYDFVFFNGDIFDYQVDEKQLITNFLKPCADTFAKNIPFVYVRGNHETRGKYCRQFINYFDNIGYQAFSFGPARFVILDTGEDKEDSHPVYADIVDFDAYREEQAALLAKEIESQAFKKAKFRIVMMHIPPRYAGDWHGSTHCNKLFEPLLNKGKVDLVLCGHTHAYKVHLPQKGMNNYPLFIGGGPRDGKRTLTKIKVNQQILKVEMLKDDGTLVGNYELSK